MAYVHPDYEEGRRKYWTRHDAHLWMRHDAWRFMPPCTPIYTGRDAVKYAEPNYGQPTEDELRKAQAKELSILLSLKAEFDAIKAEIERERLEQKRQSELR